MREYSERLKKAIRENNPGSFKGDTLRRAINNARKNSSDDRIAEEIERYGISEFIQANK